MTKFPHISVLIPFKKSTPYLKECLRHLTTQSEKRFEVILLPDKKTGVLGPAEKRDLGAKKAKGEILAFIDDDAYPSRDWLKKALALFSNRKISAVCGPGVTPPHDNLLQKAGGFVNSLWFGSGGAGTYRFTPQKRRFVDDYPSMNFLVRKKDFEKIGGFDTHFWPGEDTKLCYDIVYLLKKKIIYDPQVLVYHHRKPLFIPHLKQIARYAIHRGHFARILSKTSLRIGYLLPTLFVLFILAGGIGSFFHPWVKILYFAVISIYFTIVSAGFVYIFVKERNFTLAILAGCGIVLTHVVYGLLLPIGLLRKNLKQ